jgi:hypothetical protein
MNENEYFESLRRLLALKRHEIPPPGYFNHFSNQVITRIQAGETEKTTNLFSWLSKFLESLQAKPAFAGGFAMTLCSLLVIGIIYAGQTESAPQPLLLQSVASTATTVAPTAPQMSMEQPDVRTMLASSSTNPVFALPPVASLFDQVQPAAQPVGYFPAGN